MCLQGCAQNTRAEILHSNYANSSFILLKYSYNEILTLLKKLYSAKGKKKVWRTVYKTIEKKKKTKKRKIVCMTIHKKCLSTNKSGNYFVMSNEIVQKQPLKSVHVTIFH